MTERRTNWKGHLGKQAQARKQKRLELLTKLDETRREIRECGTDFDRYDQLKARQREVAAQLAAL
jgi:hypothetical protein